MMTFEHLGPDHRLRGDHRPSVFSIVVLVVCAIALLPLTLLILLLWGVSRLGQS